MLSLLLLLACGDASDSRAVLDDPASTEPHDSTTSAPDDDPESLTPHDDDDDDEDASSSADIIPLLTIDYLCAESLPAGSPLAIITDALGPIAGPLEALLCPSTVRPDVEAG